MQSSLSVLSPRHTSVRVAVVVKDYVTWSEGKYKNACTQRNLRENNASREISRG